jgi:AGZA family xanthine/uracil permease-like MFS transporter
MLENLFKLEAHKTNVRTELLAGLTTFLTMAYITFVNPLILSDAGMDFGAVFVATCLAAAFGTAVMGLYANYPIALAPGMGLNAFFTFAVVKGLGVSWQVALGAVFLSGIVFLIVSVLPIRTWIINSIPKTMKLAIAAGIGLFLALIGLGPNGAGIIVDNPATLVGLGDLTAAPALLAAAGFVVIVALYARNVPGAVLIGILAVTLVAVGLGVSEWKGLASLPPDPSPTLLQLDIAGAFQIGMLTVIFTFFLVDMFDTSGTLIGLAYRADMLEEDGKLPGIGKALVADSSATVVGAALGTSTTTSYIESASGILAGGRTGLTALTVAVLFVLALFFAPLAQTVPAFATAPALVFVACLMAKGLAEMNWDDATDYAPGLITAIAMPFTFSIADGIGIGFIAYVVAKALAGKFADCSPAMLIIAALFVVKFGFL